MTDPIMRNPPERIFLIPHENLDYATDSAAGVTWSDDRINDTDPEYVRADLHAAEMAALRADAARYRWLRDRGELSVRDVFGGLCEHLNDGLDFATDAAMKWDATAIELARREG